MSYLITALLGLVLLATTVPAIAVGPTWCGDGNYSASHPLAWERFDSDVEMLVKDGNIQQAYELVLNALDEELRILGSNEKSREIQAALRQYLAYVSSPNGFEAPAMFDSGSPNPNLSTEFRVLQFELELLQDGTENPVSLDVTIPCPDLVPEKNPAMRSIAHALWSMHQTATALDLENGMKIAALRSSQLYQDYENYVLRGLPMWPWEMWVNGFLVPDDFNAPAPMRQWIFLRPNVSPALVTGSTEEAGLDFGLTLELGHIWYRKKDYSSWWGVSAMAAITDDEGVGYGGLLRWDNYTLGVAHHDKNDEDLVYLSVDLYQLVVGEESRVNSTQGFMNKILNKGRQKLSDELAIQ